MGHPQDTTFIQRAVELACESVQNNGGPFGAVIVKDGRIIAEGHNQVTLNNDPSAHAEIVAIRNACQTLGRHHLDDCTLYTSCEPCPMCMAASYWAHIKRVVYSASEKDAEQAGFADVTIADEVCQPHSKKSIVIDHVAIEGNTRCFTDWLELEDREDY